MAEKPFTIFSFYEFLRENKLMATRCTACDKLWLPPRLICPDCHRDSLEWTALSGDGELVSFTVIHFGTMPMIKEGYGMKNPYCSGIVKTAEGPTISAQILGVDALDPESIQIGSRVKVEFVERENWHFVREVAEIKKSAVAFRVLS